MTKTLVHIYPELWNFLTLSSYYYSQFSSYVDSTHFTSSIANLTLKCINNNITIQRPVFCCLLFSHSLYLVWYILLESSWKLNHHLFHSEKNMNQKTMPEWWSITSMKGITEGTQRRNAKIPISFQVTCLKI